MIRTPNTAWIELTGSLTDFVETDPESNNRIRVQFELSPARKDLPGAWSATVLLRLSP